MFEEFLDENTYNLSPEEYNAILTDLETMDPADVASKYDSLLSEKTAGWANIRNKFKPLPERILSKVGSSDKTNPFDKPKTYLHDLYKSDFTDVPEETFFETVSKMKDYWDDERKEREKTAGEFRRKKEIEKEWSFPQNAFTSEYAKERYIHNPESSLFGKEAPELGKAPKTRTGATADFLAGTAGAVADIVPTPIRSDVWLGPAIRTARDYAYYDTEYGKPVDQIVQERAKDLGANAAVSFLPNFRSQMRMTKSAASGAISKALEIEGKYKAFTKDAKSVKNLLKNSNSDIIKKIDNLPDGEVKQRLEKYITDPQNINKGALFEELYKIESDATKYKNFSTLAEATQLVVDDNMKVKNMSPSLSRDLLTYPKLSTPQKLAKSGISATEYALRNPLVGNVVIKTPGNIKGTGTTKLKEDALKEWYKQNYDRDWRAGFIPVEKEGDPKWEAYKEWKLENK